MVGNVMRSPAGQVRLSTANQLISSPTGPFLVPRGNFDIILFLSAVVNSIFSNFTMNLCDF